MVILCSNVELCEYSYGDVILRQEIEPDDCIIIITGECRLVLETIIFKAQEVKASSNQTGQMRFGSQIYDPVELYGKYSPNFKKKTQKLDSSSKDSKLINQWKLNEKYSF